MPELFFSACYILLHTKQAEKLLHSGGNRTDLDLWLPAIPTAVMLPNVGTLRVTAAK
jgi:hypothetical protein